MNRPDPPQRSLRLRIDRTALAANWRALDALSGGATAGAAVKADAYGLGAAHVVPVLHAAGALQFYVAHWSEVPALLGRVPPEQVSVLHGPLTAVDAAFAVATGVRPVINSVAQARRWHDAGGGLCDLMVDTGINRLGLPLGEIGDPAIAALEIDTLHSHLASADEDGVQNAAQLALFEQAVRAVPARRRAFANSAGIALGPDYAFDQTRPGVALYGGVPRGELAGKIVQVAHPEAAVLQLRQLGAGDTVGYNATFAAPAPMTVATVSLGYADGYLRCWSNLGALGFGEALLPVLGRVSMDMVVIDARAAPALREGDWLTLPFDLPVAAAQSGLSQYELLTLLGNRYQRLDS